MAKVRELDRLIHAVACCVQNEGESLHDAEKRVRRIAEEQQRIEGRPALIIVREMWARFKKAHAHKDVNDFIANGQMPPCDYEEFDKRKAALKIFHRNARRYCKQQKDNDKTRNSKTRNGGAQARQMTNKEGK